MTGSPRPGLWLWGALAACDGGHAPNGGHAPENADWGRCEPLSLETAVGSPEFGAPPLVAHTALPLPGRGQCYAQCTVTARTDPDLGALLTWAYTFDAAGLSVRENDTEWTWNEDHLLVEIQEPGEVPSTFTYDDGGRLLRTTSHYSGYEDSADVEVTYSTTRDWRGRILAVSRIIDSTSSYANGPETQVQTFTYEPGGDRPTEILEVAAKLDYDEFRRHRMAYDERGRTVSWVSQWGTEGGASWRKPQEYAGTFDGDLLTSVDDRYDGHTNTRTVFQYDDLGRLLRREVSVPPDMATYPDGLVFERVDYDYDCE